MPRKGNKDFNDTQKKDRKKLHMRKKACRFCVDKDMFIDYKNAKLLGSFLSERGKLVPRRMTGNCACHQRKIVEAVKRARILAFIPFTVTHSSVLHG